MMKITLWVPAPTVTDFVHELNKPLSTENCLGVSCLKGI